MYRRNIKLAYRTYINNTQVFGNDEYYSEWIEYIKSKGIAIGEDGDYTGELDDFMETLDVIEAIVMRLEAERRERKKKGVKYGSQSIFDLGHIYDNVLEDPTGSSLLDEELHYIKNGYMFLPYAFLKACEDIIEYKGHSLKGKHLQIFKLKDGCKIKVSGG